MPRGACKTSCTEIAGKNLHQCWKRIFVPRTGSRFRTHVRGDHHTVPRSCQPAPVPFRSSPAASRTVRRTPWHEPSRGWTREELTERQRSRSGLRASSLSTNDNLASKQEEPRVQSPGESPARKPSEKVSANREKTLFQVTLMPSRIRLNDSSARCRMAISISKSAIAAQNRCSSA